MKPAVVWSPDSKRILTYKIDHRNAASVIWFSRARLTAASAQVASLRLPFACDENVPKLNLYNQPRTRCNDERCSQDGSASIGATQVKVKMDPVQQLYYGAPRCWTHWSTGDDQRIYLMRRNGIHRKRLYAIDPKMEIPRYLSKKRAPLRSTLYTAGGG